jgi:hypothetical protein
MMRLDLRVLAFGFVAALVTVLVDGCYRCDGPTCSNVDPRIQPDYPGADGVVEVLPDDSVGAAASPCGRACESMRRAGCPEGMPNARGTSCYRVCVRAASLQRLPLACVAGAVGQEQIRACGFVRCVP